MLGVIIFDRLNDVMFSHGDEKFEEHIRCMAARNGLFYPAFSEAVPETRGERADVLLQLFSPFLASQRIMALEFHDPYSEVECENGLKMVFHEYLTYQCLCLSRNSALAPRKYISAVVSLAKLLCGPVLHRLKSMDGGLARMLSSMLESYCQLQRTNQAYHVEAVERLIIGDQVQNKMVSLLQRVVTGLPSGARSHAFLTVDGTLVSLYSGSKVTELSPAAVLSLLLLVHAVTPNAGQTGESGADPDGTSSFGASMNAGASTGFSASMGGAGGGGSMSEPGTGTGGGGGGGGNAEDSNLVHEELCFLSASRSPLSPYLVYVVHVWPGMALVIVCDLCLTDISGGLCEAIESVARYQQAVTAFQRDQVYAHLKHGLTVLFACAKQIRHNSEVRQLLGRLQTQWDQLRRLKVDAVLCSGQQVPPAVDQGLAALSRTLEAAFEALCHALPERATLTTAHLLQLLEQVQHELDHYRSFLLARAVSNATVETRSHLSISRYLENFPDLVHFIYVDRSVHLMTAPSTRPPDGSHDLTETVRKMIDLAYKYLREGHMSIIWRDQHYSYGHFVWFEDAMGNPQKARESPRRLKALYADWQPGILVRDYFSALVSVCFPEAAPEEVRCYQLFLVHRGPVQSDRVLQQSQQIARTVWEVSGAAAAPLDLL